MSGIEPGKLLAWYDERKRDLPWRRPPVDPYRVWISEIMLQQTRVDTVIPYYERFLARFPTPAALADAPIDAVLALWSGLGYYARARNLHRAAKKIRAEHGGEFPSDPDAVRALPGIGPYTAGAILSIAFGRREALVDGNVIRVLARQHLLDGSAKDTSLKNACWEIARGLVSASVRRPGDFNQALMELGATVCTTWSPRCSACPVSNGCRAREEGRAEEIPAAPPKSKRPHRRVECAIIQRAERVLLVRRPDEGLLGGLWELPSSTRPASLEESIRDSLGLSVAREGRRVVRVEHAFSHFDMTLDAFACEVTGGIADAGGAWVAREDLPAYGMSAAMRKVLAARFSASRTEASSSRRRPASRARGSASAPRGRRASGRSRRRRTAPPRRCRRSSR